MVQGNLERVEDITLDIKNPAGKYSENREIKRTQQIIVLLIK